MELDLLNPGSIIYTDFNAILTTDGIESILIAGNASFKGRGYKNGAGSLAVFDSLRGFLQLSKKEIIVVEWGSSCLRMIERPMNLVSDITKPCPAWNGQVRPFLWLNSVVKDKVNLQKLFVTKRRAIRQLTLNSWEVSTFFESAQIEKFKHLVQDSQGDVFVTAGAAVYKIGYKDKVIQLLAGAPERSGFDSPFSDQSYQIGRAHV